MTHRHINNQSVFSAFTRRVRNTFTYILLSQFEYCHVVDHRTGQILLYEGPKRIRLYGSQEILLSPTQKIRLLDGQFTLILNPYNPLTGRIENGEREVRVGPAIFPLYPGEKVDGEILQEFVIEDDEALLIHAEKDIPHPRTEGAILRAGEEFLLRGPTRYVPHKDIRVVERRASKSLSATEGVYVQNDDSGEVVLVRGPVDVFLEQNESLWDKELTHEELQALGYLPQMEDRPKDKSRVLASSPRKRDHLSDAVVIDLEDKEAIYLYDGEKVRVEFGPATIFLEPHERPKVLFISGGIPVRPNVLRISKLGLGPDFIRDQLVVRTRDNATLLLDVTYRWQFLPGEDSTKIFSLKDFVGFVALTLSSQIREEAARHDFEDLHARAVELVKAAILGVKGQRVFTENDLIIFGVDVERITPDDEEIQEKLAEAIKTNVDIYTNRVQEEAKLESERRLIEGRVKNEAARAELITQELANERQKRLEMISLDSEIEEQRATLFAQTHGIRSTAEREAEIERLSQLSNVLDSKGGKAYIELERARILQETDKVIVPTDSKLVLGLDRLVEE